MKKQNMAVDEETEMIAESMCGPLAIGKRYYILTVTYHFVAKIESLFKFGGQYFVKLTQAHMISESGPYSDFYNGKITSQEKMDCPVINVASIVIANEYPEDVVIR